MKNRDVNRRQQRHDTIKAHLVQEQGHDPYKARGKPTEPSVCPRCTAVFAHARWQWIEPEPRNAHSEICPACRRIDDKFPAGEVTLSGAFLAGHAAEIIALVRNTEAAEKRSHPLQRIMDIVEEDQRIVVTTTDIHLPRRLGHALTAAYKGKLDTHYDEAGYFVRMSWSRET